MNQQIIDFINQCREAGVSDDDCRSQLVEAGWQELDINESFGATSISKDEEQSIESNTKPEAQSEVRRVDFAETQAPEQEQKTETDDQDSATENKAAETTKSDKKATPSKEEVSKQLEDTKKLIKMLIISFVVVGVVAGGYLAVAKFAFNAWPFGEKAEKEVVQEEAVIDEEGAKIKPVNCYENAECFETKFVNCEPAKFTMVFLEDELVSRQVGELEVIGKQEEQCEMTFTVLEDPSVEIVGKKMTCLSEYGVPFSSIMRNFEDVCTGDLVDTLSENFVSNSALGESLRQARDSARVSDLATLNSALALYMADVSRPDLCKDPKEIYASARITPPSGWKLGGNPGSRAVDGTGWLPVDFTEISSGAPIGALMVDPENDPERGLVYTYVCSENPLLSFEINTKLESAKYANPSKGLMVTDGGDSVDFYEVGNDAGLDLMPRGVFGVGASPSDEKLNQNEESDKSDKYLISERDIVLGEDDAPVTIIEYGDYQCSFCAKFFNEVERSIKNDYIAGGKVKMVFRNFQFLGDESIAAAEAAECANDQGKFWEYHDAIYGEELRDGKSRNGNLSRSLFLKLSIDAGLNSSTFIDCIDDKKHEALIQQDNKDAQKLGIQSTPTTYINEIELLGAQPYSAFKAVIDAELAKVSKDESNDSAASSHSCSVTPMKQTVSPGESVEYDLALNPSKTGTGFILSSGKLPSGMGISFNPSAGDAKTRASKILINVNKDVSYASRNMVIIYYETRNDGQNVPTYCQLNLVTASPV